MAPIFLLGIWFATILFVLTLISQLSKPQSKSNLPPGTSGWPIIGETLSYVRCPEDFIRERMRKYSTDVFRTSLAGEKVYVFCGASANKFVFTNEDKLLKNWLPPSLADALSHPNYIGRSGSPSWVLASETANRFLKLDSIQHHVPCMDAMVQQHLEREWMPYGEVKVYPLAKELTFALSCRLFFAASEEQTKELAKSFFVFSEGILAMPLNIPGMSYYRARKAGDVVRTLIVDIVRERRVEMSKKTRDERDLLDRLLIATDQSGEVLDDKTIASKFIGFLFGGFITSSKAMAFLISYLAEHPDAYEMVLQEQLEILQEKEKGSRELLDWEDVKKMKYSWNAVRETLRLMPPGAGSFREAVTDFTYAGFSIPKGSKILWSTYSTHKDAKHYTEPENFNPTRFEGKGPMPYTYTPFGGGPPMCKGAEYARVQILVFLHNVITKFIFKKVNPHEKVLYDPDPVPAEGLRISIQSRNL